MASATEATGASGTGAAIDMPVTIGGELTVPRDAHAPADFWTAAQQLDGPANGYSILQAPDLESAVALVKGHPFVGRGGSLQVSTATLPG
jgi:hypothetical protein